MGDSLVSVIRTQPALIQVKGLAVRSFLFRSFFNLLPTPVVGIPLANESPLFLGDMDI